MPDKSALATMNRDEIAIAVDSKFESVEVGKKFASDSLALPTLREGSEGGCGSTGVCKSGVGNSASQNLVGGTHGSRSNEIPLVELPQKVESDREDGPSAKRDSASTRSRGSSPLRENRKLKHAKIGAWGRLVSRFRKVKGLPAAIYRARRGEVQLPRVLTHTVTFGCNAKCVMCDSWQLPTKGDLTLQEINRIYDELPEMDAVRLTGGEPFVRRDFPDIYQSALDRLRPFFVHVSSNGFLTDRIIQFCHERDRSVPLELAISLDGVGEYHNQIRANSNAWKSAWATLNELAPLRKKLNLHLVVNQTIVDDTGVDHYESLHRHLRVHDIEHHVVIAYAESATYSLDRDRRVEVDGSYSMQSDLDKAAVLRLLQLAEKRASKLPRHRKWMRKYYLQGMQERLSAAESPKNPVCQALHTHLRMFPNGDVPVCQFNSKLVGSLRSESFAQVWTSKASHEERKWVRDCAGCWAECEVAPSALYTLDFIQKQS